MNNYILKQACFIAGATLIFYYLTQNVMKLFFPYTLLLIGATLSIGGYSLKRQIGQLPVDSIEEPANPIEEIVKDNWVKHLEKPANPKENNPGTFMSPLDAAPKPHIREVTATPDKTQLSLDDLVQQRLKQALLSSDVKLDISVKRKSRGKNSGEWTIDEGTGKIETIKPDSEAENPIRNNDSIAKTRASREEIRKLFTGEK